MPVGMFGDKVFSVSKDRIFTFRDFSRKESLNVEEQESEGQRPSSYVKGSDLGSIGFSMDLVRSKGLDVQKEMDSWILLKNKATPSMLFIGDKPHGTNKWLLVDINISGLILDHNGRTLKCKIDLGFKEFVRRGVKKEDDKRYNSNASEAVANGAV